jgi:hypothetical protein
MYFQRTSCVHTPVGNSNTLGLYWLITSYFEAFFLKERMNVSDSSHRMSFSHYKQHVRFSNLRWLQDFLDSYTLNRNYFLDRCTP